MQLSAVLAFLKEHNVSNGDMDLAVCWPHKSRSMGRMYGYAIDLSGAKICSYLKFATNKEDVECLENEIAAVRRMDSLNVSFSYPRVKGAKYFSNDILCALFEMLPCSKEPFWSVESWEKSVSRYKREFSEGTCYRISKSDALSLKWVSLLSPNSIADAFAESVESGMEVCATHGDMACHNFRFDGSNHWIFDWETYTDNGPVLVDELTVFMCVRRYRKGWPASDVFSDLENRYPMSDPLVRDKVIQALSFIVANKLSMADVLEEEILKYAKANESVDC